MKPTSPEELQGQGQALDTRGRNLPIYTKLQGRIAGVRGKTAKVKQTVLNNLNGIASDTPLWKIPGYGKTERISGVPNAGMGNSIKMLTCEHFPERYKNLNKIIMDRVFDDEINGSLSPPKNSSYSSPGLDV